MADEEPRELLPTMQSRRVLGREYKPNEYGGRSPIPTGFFGSAALGAGTAALDVAQRWRALADNRLEPYPTDEERAEIIGDRPLQAPLSLSRGELERRAALYDREEYVSRYDSGMLGELVGALPVYAADPVNVATMFAGGANFARAAGAATFRQFIRESAIGGAKVGAYSAPLEVRAQQMARGEARLEEAALATLAPVVVSPLLSAPGYVLRALRGRRNADSLPGPVADDLTRNPAYPEAMSPLAARYAQDELLLAPRPPIMPGAGPTPEPTTRLQETFGEFEGGTRNWLREFAAGAPRAIEYARARGIDPESDELRSLVADEAIHSALVSKRTTEDLRRLVNDATALAQGTADANSVARLRFAGMLDAEGRLLPEFEALPNGAQATQMFLNQGPEAVWATRAKRQAKLLERRKNELAMAETTSRQARVPDAKLPRDLSKSAPRFQNKKLRFENDVDRAAYAIADTRKRSKRDADFVQFVKTALDVDEATARDFGATVKARVKQAARGDPHADELMIPPSMRDPEADPSVARRAEIERNAARRRYLEAQEEMERLTRLGRTVDAGKIRPERVAAAVDAARMERASIDSTFRNLKPIFTGRPDEIGLSPPPRQPDGAREIDEALQEWGDRMLAKVGRSRDDTQPTTMAQVAEQMRACRTS